MLREITESPYLNLLSGLILLITSAYEIMVTMNGTMFGIRHGILVFSVIQIVKAIPDIMHGLTEIEEADQLMEE